MVGLYLLNSPWVDKYCDYFIIKMSLEHREQHQIEEEIKKRIVPENLTPNDLDFYVRKVRRLETDNAQLTDELNKLRVKLRRAEDFEIKYEVLLGEQTKIKKEIEEKEKAVREFKTLNEKLTIAIDERSNKHEEWNIEKRGLLQQIEKWTLKAEQSEVRRLTQLAEEKTRNEQSIKKEVQFVKKDFQEREDQYKFDIRQLKKIIHEKEAVQTIVSGRVEKIRKEKDEEIERLANVILDEKEQRSKAIEQKNEEISRIKQKFQKMINFELQNIKKNLEDQGEVFSIELNGLKEIISIKNQEITKLLSEIKRQAAEHEEDRDVLRSEIASLKEQIYRIEREGELQLYNLRQKLMEIQAADLRDLEKRYQELIQTLKTDKGQLENFLKEKEKQREEEKKDYDRNLHQLHDKIKEREQRITALLDRIKESGDLNTGELKDLHESFHKIEVEKETLTSEYQTNITFMTQQIAKLTAANDVKNAELKKLFEQLHETKQKFEQHLKQNDLKMKKERKEYEDQKERDKKERQRIAEDLAAAERDFKNAERRLIREKEKEEREKNKMKFMVEESERDIERLNKYIKSLDENLKNEYKKSQMNILDGDSSRRQAVSRLEKQKIQLQTLKNIEIDQIKRKYQIDTTRVIQQNEKLKTDLVTKSVALQKAEAELKRIDFNQRNSEKINRDKILDYEKKMATLNNEVNLTQQLYKTFMEAKARKNPK